MNSEELEQSLRTEFESYLKTVLAEMRQEMSQLQERVEAEIEKHKEQLDQIFQNAFSRVNDERGVDAGFRESVVEHLRLARDEGARITATAIAEAEEMEKQKAAETPPKAGFAELREAINEISTKTSQSEILKSLVNHASQFAPRGAFFVVKNEHFVGWRKFGNEKGDNEEAVREVFLPVTADSILSEAARLLSTVESTAETFADDAAILEKLEFGSPETMFAIPLVARGRGVAVLYADQGNEGAHLDTDALETMVKVAGLTVELLASAKPASRKKASAAAGAAAPVMTQAEETQEPSYYEQPQSYSYEETPAVVSESSHASQTDYQTSFESQPAATSSYQSEPQNFASNEYSMPNSYAQEETPAQSFEEVSTTQPQTSYPTYDDSSWNQPQVIESDYSTDYSTESSAATTSEHTQDFSFQPSVETQSGATNDYQFETSQQQYESLPQVDSPTQFDNASSSFDSPQQQVESFDGYAQQPATDSYAPIQTESSYGSFDNSAAEKASSGFSDVMETSSVSQTAPQSATPVRTRFSERNVDLPIEVTEDERRLHNDARRFARLLVSEIKLYNEQKVKEGRESSDLYERLREAIDRSREMYDKRVQPSVAAKFDYFHYELINSLAEGEEGKLGTTYPGATV